VTITAVKPEAFTLPESIENHFKRAIREEMVLSAFNTCNHLSKTWVRQELPRRFELPVFCSASYSAGVTRQLIAVHLRTNVVNEAIEAQQAKAVATLQKKINQGLKDGETITDVELHVDDQNMISGTVSGEGFTLTVRSIWNYRYRENSANGILTVYAQTRVNRKELG
jgi:uncharacterized protein YoaH (UPF0181 family)|tara:strand:+ start:459 stop:962 length:504 start_codon:yes stop_codon:yes gene_type:complete